MARQSIKERLNERIELLKQTYAAGNDTPEASLIEMAFRAGYHFAIEEAGSVPSAELIKRLSEADGAGNDLF